MHTIKPPFRYSGSKWRLLQKVNFDLPKFNRIVEPYCGSCSFSMCFNKSFVGYDLNSDLIELWNWLKTTTDTRLLKIQQIISNCNDKMDVRNIIELSPGEITYIRINMTGLFVGQLSSWKLYKQFNLPIQNTLKCLPHIQKHGTFINKPSNAYNPRNSDLIFLDPPYLHSLSNYIDKSNKKNCDIYNKLETEELIDKINNVGAKYIFTYGTTAKKDFPGFKWAKILSKKMPNSHKPGEFKIRDEFITSNIPFDIIKENA